LPNHSSVCTWAYARRTVASENVLSTGPVATTPSFTRVTLSVPVDVVEERSEVGVERWGLAEGVGVERPFGGLHVPAAGDHGLAQGVGGLAAGDALGVAPITTAWSVAQRARG